MHLLHALALAADPTPTAAEPAAAPAPAADAVPTADAVPAADAPAEGPLADGEASADAPVAQAGPPRRPGGRGPPPGARPPGAKPPPGKAPPGKPPGAHGDGHGRVESPFRPYALLQIWGTAYDMDVDAQADATGYGDAEDDVGFKIKRARVGLDFAKAGFNARIVAGIGAPYDAYDDREGEFTLYEGSLGYTHKALTVTGGLTSVPFSRDAMMSSGELTFQERGLAAEHIAPYRQLGVVGRLDVSGLGVHLGAFNSGGDLFGDDNAGKTAVARLEYTAGKRDVYRTWSDDAGFGLGVGGGGFYTADVATQTVAGGLDLMLRAGGLSLLADGSFAKVTPTASDVATPGVYDGATRIGVTGQVGYTLKTLEPAARVSYYNETEIGAFTQLYLGLVWHGTVAGIPDLVRIGGGYEMRLESTGSVPNDTARLWAQFAWPPKSAGKGPPSPGGPPAGGPPPGGPGGGGPPSPGGAQAPQPPSGA